MKDFFKDTVTYLGYKIDKHGLHTDTKKIEAIVLVVEVVLVILHN